MASILTFARSLAFECFNIALVINYDCVLFAAVYNMYCVCRVALVVNCGYARVCIYQNYNPHRTGKSSRKDIDIAKRQMSFEEQFSCNYCFPADYFYESSKHAAQFDRDCNKILDGFKGKFPLECDKESHSRIPSGVH